MRRRGLGRPGWLQPTLVEIGRLGVRIGPELAMRNGEVKHRPELRIKHGHRSRLMRAVGRRS